MKEFLSTFTNSLETHPYLIREVFDVQRCLGNKEVDRLSNLNNRIDEITARGIESKFINNSFVAYEYMLGTGRPLSAFYTYFKNEGIVVIEAGGINESGESKLHDFLRDTIDYNKRRDQGALVRSGHIGSVINLELNHPTRIALFDCFTTDSRISVSSQDYPIVATLLKNDIIPVTSDGHPVCIY